MGTSSHPAPARLRPAGAGPVTLDDAAVDLGLLPREIGPSHPRHCRRADRPQPGTTFWVPAEGGDLEPLRALRGRLEGELLPPERADASLLVPLLDRALDGTSARRNPP